MLSHRLNAGTQSAEFKSQLMLARAGRVNVKVTITFSPTGALRQ